MFKIKLSDFKIHEIDAEFKQHYLSTNIEYRGRKRDLIVMFKDAYEPIEITEHLTPIVAGELHEGRLDEPLTLVDAQFIK